MCGCSFGSSVRSSSAQGITFGDMDFFIPKSPVDKKPVVIGVVIVAIIVAAIVLFNK